MDEEVEQFMTVTGEESDRIARGYLGVTGGDPMQAIQLYFENPDLKASFAAPAASASASAGGRQPASSSRSRNRGHTGREDASGVIHIDSDDDGDVPMSDDPNDEFVIPDDDDDDDGVAAVARNAQEEEDAAMARRLQEEMYGSSGGPAAAEDGVRAPIARTHETLMAPDPSWGLHDDDPEDEALQQLRQRQQARRGQNSSNPFQPRSVWADPSAPPVPVDTRPGAPASTSRVARLADLFHPPTDIMFRESWDAARDEGKENKKWILVNLQDMSIFQCQALNRDLWKDENIKSLIREHFVFLQYDKDDRMSQSYINFYLPNQGHENSDNYPHVSIIDPRTGEQVKVWSGKDFPQKSEFYSDLIEFLDRYSLAANSKNPVVKSKPKAKQVDVGRLTEEEMLELALQNSLDNGGGSGTNVQDPDSLTKPNADVGKGKGKASDEAIDLAGSSVQTRLSPPPTSESAFARISSTTPHVEPENNPATTTRIQFRHSGGRTIRRFSVADPVRRLYEWLKAEPMEGKEGVQFELKAMPAGRDLIEELDKTIEEAGLKQATVMIEFIED